MAGHPRPLSPHLQIYRRQLTSVLSILHRITGIGLAVGLLYLVCWLVAAARGAESFDALQSFNGSIIGRLLLLGWSVAFFYHLLNGIRHLAWDLGYGFGKDESRRMSVIIIVLSLVFALAIFACAWTGHAGYLQ